MMASTADRAVWYWLGPSPAKATIKGDVRARRGEAELVHVGSLPRPPHPLSLHATPSLSFHPPVLTLPPCHPSLLSLLALPLFTRTFSLGNSRKQKKTPKHYIHSTPRTLCPGPRYSRTYTPDATRLHAHTAEEMQAKHAHAHQSLFHTISIHKTPEHIPPRKCKEPSSSQFLFDAV